MTKRNAVVCGKIELRRVTGLLHAKRKYVPFPTWVRGRLNDLITKHPTYLLLNNKPVTNQQSAWLRPLVPPLQTKPMVVAVAALSFEKCPHQYTLHLPRKTTQQVPRTPRPHPQNQTHQLPLRWNLLTVLQLLRLLHAPAKLLKKRWKGWFTPDIRPRLSGICFVVCWSFTAYWLCHFGSVSVPQVFWRWQDDDYCRI